MTLTRDQLEAAIVGELEERPKPPTELAHYVSFAGAVADRLRLGADAPELPAERPRFFDFRLEQDYRYPGGARKVRRRGGQVVRRDPSRVTGIVLHQTAVEYGLTRRQVEAASGDQDLAMARRGLEVACHAIAFRRGVFVATHPLEVHVNHGNGLNATTLGLEVDGRYAGLEDDPETAAREDLRTTWRGAPTKLDERTVETARAALRWLVEEGRREGMPITKIWAHRQSSATRRSDPGEALWRALVVDYAVPELGLTTAPELTVGDGRAIPREWDPAGTVAY